MSAAVLRDPEGPYVIEEVSLAAPAADEVLVRIVAAGMCHTDVLPRAAASFAPLPIVTGHEGSGVVEAVGAEVVGVSEGDHVVLTFDSCGACDSCRAGAPPYCDTFLARNLVGRRLDGTTGITGPSGEEISSRWFGQSSFATHAVATTRNVVVVDRALPLATLAPLGCGVLTGAGTVLTTLDVKPGASIVVLGAGAVGLSAVMAARAAGAGIVVAADIHEHRLDMALELGATHVLRGDADDLLADLLAITGGGAHHSVDTTGAPDVMRIALACLRMAGVCGFVGVQTGDLCLDGLALVGKTAIGVLEGGADPQVLVPRLIDMWQRGDFPFDRLVETFALSEINEAEEASLSGRVVKPVLLPTVVPRATGSRRR